VGQGSYRECQYGQVRSSAEGKFEGNDIDHAVGLPAISHKCRKMKMRRTLQRDKPFETGL